MKTKTGRKPAKKIPFRAFLDGSKNPDVEGKKGMSLDQFVREAAKHGEHVTFSTAAKWSSGVHIPRAHDQKELAKAFPGIRW